VNMLNYKKTNSFFTVTTDRRKASGNILSKVCNDIVLSLGALEGIVPVKDAVVLVVMEVREEESVVVGVRSVDMDIEDAEGGR
jgi:hypothetical protein